MEKERGRERERERERGTESNKDENAEKKSGGFMQGKVSEVCIAKHILSYKKTVLSIHLVNLLIL